MRGLKLDIGVVINVGLILILGLTIRIIIGKVFNYDADFRGGDSGYYLEVARNILESAVHGVGSPPESTYFRAPLYSLFSAGVIYLFGESALAFYIAQGILTILLGVAIYLMLRRFHATLAILVALMVVGSPSDVFFNGRVLGEGLVTFFLVLGVVQVYCARSSFQYFIAGLLFAFSSLVRDVYVLLPICFIFYFLFYRREPMRFSVFLLIGFLLGVGPWILRNSIQDEGGLFISKGSSGYNLWVGTWERDSQWTINQKFPDYAFSSDEERNSVRYSASDNDDKYMRQLALARLTSDPIGVVFVWIKRAPQLWVGTRSDLVTLSYDRYSIKWYLIKYVLFGLNLFILISAAIGIFMAVKKRDELVIIAIPLIYTILIYLPFHSTETRYSQPMYPIIFIFMVYFFIEVFARFRNRAVSVQDYVD